MTREPSQGREKEVDAGSVLGVSSRHAIRLPATRPAPRSSAPSACSSSGRVAQALRAVQVSRIGLLIAVSPAIQRWARALWRLSEMTGRIAWRANRCGGSELAQMAIDDSAEALDRARKSLYEQEPS